VDSCQTECTALSESGERGRDQFTGRGEENDAVERLGRVADRLADPFRAELASEGAVPLATNTRLPRWRAI
jgi:hypothetical protein